MPGWINNDSNSSDPGKQRRRWEIEDKKLLKNLKYQLANDGSSEVQYDLGKQLLEDTEEIARQIQGIGYLKKAAEQGHEMALELLGACFRTGRGITAANENDVRKFLSMTPSERSAKRAAQELFASLSGGEEFVTVEQLEKRMREIYKLQKKKKKHEDVPGPSNNGNIPIKDKDADDDANSSSSSSPAHFNSPRDRIMDDSNHISEANLLSAAHNYSNGIIPTVNQALAVSIPHPQSLDHVPCLHRPFFHPTMFFALLYHQFITIFSSVPGTFNTRLQIFIVLAYAITSTDNFSIFLPTIAYYISLSIMIVSSFKMLKTKHEFIDFRIWSGLFLSYDDHVNARDSENLYLRNNMKPYLWFFTSFAANLMLFPLISDQWLPHSEITVVAFVLTFLTMFCFMYTSSSSVPDLLMLFSFALNVLAKYPYELDTVVTNKWRFLDLKLPGFSTYVIGSGIEFSMNSRGLLYLMIPVFMFFLAKRRNWQGIFQFLIPHCVTLAWLQISIISAQSSTTFGMIRSSLALAGIFFFLPLFGLVTLLIPVFAAVEWMSLTDATNRIFVTISTSIIAIIGSCFMAISNRVGKYVTLVQILLCILASCFLFRPYIMGNNETLYASYIQQSSTESKNEQNQRILDSLDDTNSLNWDFYHKYCLSSSHSNRISTQIRCSHLDGSEVYWDGIVSDVSIGNAKNWRRDVLMNYIPEILSNYLICYFGELNQVNCFDGEHCEIKDFIEGQKKCNVDKWNTYEYEIEVKVPSSSSGILNLNTRHESKVLIKAEHEFGNFTQRLNASDKIWFKGILRTSLNSKVDEFSAQKSYDTDVLKRKRYTVVELTSIGCLHCADNSLSPSTLKSNLKMNNRIKDLQRALKYLLNVLFNPLVTFK
ncbi:CLUMA_CG001997, isoform A [Clunio marinus]|uniref:CLUMA_CG001997, isoform A n=1 Tax=Clunio marinus TaxID=568069 RepID=A0A1J1HJI3_9DIPT|nr:CLUMA_CG001997, isoform A [Clunio marinus]